MLRLPALLLSALLASPATVSGAEWRTSRENFCTARCAISERDGVEAFNCPVVDGRRVEFDPRQNSHSGRPVSGEISEDDRYFWDYCTPAPLENIGEEGGRGTAEAATLPERIDGGSGGSGWNSGSGGSGSNSGSSSGLASSLPGVDCQGQCSENNDGYRCRVNMTSSFYCSPESAMDRKQVSSRMKLWCIGKCERKGSTFECRTMAGLDQCSPSRNKTVTGEKCVGECREEEGEHKHYKCSTSQDGPDSSQHCGNWEVSQDHGLALEYDDQDRVCAGPCQDRDGDQVCTVVQWAWDEDRQQSQLETTFGYCGAGKDNMARTIGIVVGCLAAAVLIIVIVAVVMCKNKGYFRANTQEQQ